MADIHIVRKHTLGLKGARKVAYRWAEQAEENLQMQCTYEEGKTSDTVGFKRSGADGTLAVTSDSFVLNAKLGFLLGAFKGRIEAEIVKNLDGMLAEKPVDKLADKLTVDKPKSASAPATKKSAAKKK